MSRRRMLLVVTAVLLGGCCCVPAGAFGSSDGRVYEMVSPPYKGGYGANAIRAVATSGESILFESLGAFAGQPTSSTGPVSYLARRETSDWSTVPVMPPAELAPYGSLDDVDANLESVLYKVRTGPNEGIASTAGELEFIAHATDTPDIPDNWQLEGVSIEGPLEGPIKTRPEVTFVAASADFSHIVFDGADEEPLVLEAEGTTGQVYELVSDLGSEPAKPRLVGVNNKESEGEVFDSLCPVVVGKNRSSTRISPINVVSADGSEVFFTTNVVTGSSECGENATGDPQQLFVRLNGRRTVEISKPFDSSKAFGGCIGEVEEAPGEVPCKGADGRASAEFDGASSDGSIVFFTTAAQLVSGDTQSDDNLYTARLGCPGGEEECEREPDKKEVLSLAEASHDPNGQAADVQGVVSVAPDGEHVYFVARGDLSSTSERETLVGEGRGVPQVGADNLYVYDSSSEKVSFVADLCSGPGLSGEALDGDCPLGLGQNSNGKNDLSLWLRESREVETTENGQFLIFSSYGRLVTKDTDSSRDVYWYDTETGALERVSAAEEGADNNGNNSGYEAALPELMGGERAISKDGMRVLFTSAEPLSEQAVNGLTNLYEWRQQPGAGEGRVSLISTGTANESVSKAAISSGGSDVFFVTSQGLVTQDTDGEDDVYDARLDGGFPSLPTEAQPCEGDACQGPLTNPTPLLVPGSVAQASGGNFSAPVSKPSVKKKVKKIKKKAKKVKKKKKVKGGKASKRNKVVKASGARRVAHKWTSGEGR